MKRIFFTFVLFLFLSCENPLEDRVDDLEKRQVEQEIKYQETLDSLMLIIQNQNEQIAGMIVKSQKMIDSLSTIYYSQLDSLNSAQRSLIDSLINEQQTAIDSMLANQQSLIENIIKTQPKTEFVDEQLFNTLCPQEWTEIDISHVVGKKKTLLILRVDRVLTNSDYIAFRPNGETKDWLSNNSSWKNGANSLSIVNLKYAESGLVMVYTDDEGKIEMRTNLDSNVYIIVKLIFYTN